ncbi:MAG: SDR family NAD(P)-dependent oxidoreductase [Drouetiella hepatica Uher 2000/2452]|jgi:NAD(P)-dependent dehydrogenase (short-subunit alcohol dehydrogenase family)|uniref:SDR family NAD(P)-dependent oxidoreductase n=1 Tax=Drouetiella hepatica Uher 2000/2452 TaxID=904376 RepID=A0A951QCF0_9CYAN|nr:SDR family NAD(P)-dependent oxidoreductase [Drouetiella hepatica Uher 2000/2452]
MIDIANSPPEPYGNPADNSSKAALIVGAGQGIGLGFVQQMLQTDRPQRIYATYRNPQSELLTLDDSRLQCLPMDITEEIQIAAVVEKIRSEVKGLHTVINCVGVLHDGTMQPEKSLRQINADQLLRYFQVNSIGAVLLAKQVQPLLKHGDRAIFATISAKVGSIGDNQLGGWYGYRASKAALNMLMKNTAIEYKRTCPRAIVVTLHPGTTDTQLSQPFQRNVPTEKLFSVDRTVQQLLEVIDRLQESDSGEFFSWNGDRLPW